MPVKHYILTNDGQIAEYSTEQAFLVANGLSALPEFADTRQRYVQVQYDEPEESTVERLQVRVSGAYVSFDDQGRLSGAGTATDGREPISRFEQDTCVQLALREALREAQLVH